MSNYQYSSDLLNDALFRAGEPTDDTSNWQSQAVSYLNRAYQALWTGGAEFDSNINEIWWWLQAEGTLTLQASIETGTVNVSNNSTSITLSSAPSSSVSGWFFKVDSHADVFKISSHTGGAISATLDSVYTDSDDTAASYKLFKLEYDLASDLMYLISPMRGYQSSKNKIEGMSLQQMEDQFPLNETSQDVPTRFAMVDENTVRFNRYPSQLTRIDYDYIKRDTSALTDSGSQEPLVPIQYRRVLSLMTAFWILQDKNDDRRTEAGLEAKSLLRAMAKENRVRWSRIGSMGNIYPRQRERQSLIQGPLRSESGYILG